MAKTTIASLSRDVSTEADAYLYLEDLRWKGTPVCPFCKGLDVYFIQPKNGASRKTRTGAQSERRVWKCRDKGCGKQFSVLTGTIMHGTRIPIRVWVLVYFEFMGSKNGMSAREVERRYGVCPRSAWFMLHRIRHAMEWDWADRFTDTQVIADETYVGGNPKNWHGSSHRLAGAGRGTHKVPVVSINPSRTAQNPRKRP